MTRRRRARTTARVQRRQAAPRRRARRIRSTAAAVAPAVEIRQIDSLRTELQRIGAGHRPPRWNANPDDVRRSVVKLVLTLVEFVRQLLERQAIRRVDAGTLSEEQTEAIGLALMRLEETICDLGAQFDISPEDLNLDLGPIGRLV